MWTQATANVKEINPMVLSVDNLADVVNKLSLEDFQKFQRCLKRSVMGVIPNAVEDDSDNVEHCIDQLTRRENEVLVLVASGYSRKEIGTTLRISENTAASHIASIYRKLDISSIAEATNIAIRVGII